MNAKALSLILLTLPSLTYAQGFAGLGEASDGFAVPQQGYEFIFPDDHGPHPDFRIEWWYITANMTGPDGTDYGLQWTLFRSALTPDEGAGWATPQLYMGHAAVTTPEEHFVTERLGRGGIGTAGVTADPFEAWIDEWSLSGDFDTLDLTASGPEFSYAVTLTSDGPTVFHGDDGYSVKSAEGQASYYYSLPFLTLEGVLTLPSGDVPVTGHAWLDREWSSQPLSETQTGWDWFSLSFDSGDKLMGFRLRQTDGDDYTYATWIAEDGTTTAMPDGALTTEPLSMHQTIGAEVPVRWRVTLPEKGIDIVTEAINPNAWMTTSVPYWEGPVRVSGSHQGVGYLEMTGYE